MRWRAIALVASIVAALPGVAGRAAAAPADRPAVQSPAAALATDAEAYAALHGVAADEAQRRLRAQLETVPVTDALAAEFADRLAGIAIEHDPWRIVVLLTGTDPVATRIVAAGGMTVPIVFRTDAPATRAALLDALTRQQGALRAALRRPPGLGIDPRTGTLVAMVSLADLEAEGAEPLAARLSDIAGVPVRLRVVARPDMDMAQQEAPLPPSTTLLVGGARVAGIDPVDERRYVCTTGFAVTDGARAGIATAAHCPDVLRYVERGDGAAVPLDFLGQWGWGYQDVQLHAPEARAPDATMAPEAGAWTAPGAAIEKEGADATIRPLFHGDAAKAWLRPVTGQQTRARTRAGDTLCHRGERTGYSCSTVELTDFAPAGDLCGGACTPSWVTVAGPVCKAGDSGAPVFLGTVAYGIVKGGTYRADGSCAFYFYMSLDYLPPGWSLLTTLPSVAPPADLAPGPVLP